MANDIISQITIGSTTYDICDATARNSTSNLSATVSGLKFKSVNLFNYSQVTLPATSVSGTSLSLGELTAINCNVVKDGDTYHWPLLTAGLSGFTMLGCIGWEVHNTVCVIDVENKTSETQGPYIAIYGRNLYKNSITVNVRTAFARTLWIKYTSSNIQIDNS